MYSAAVLFLKLPSKYSLVFVFLWNLLVFFYLCHTAAIGLLPSIYTMNNVKKDSYYDVLFKLYSFDLSDLSRCSHLYKLKIVDKIMLKYHIRAYSIYYYDTWCNYYFFFLINNGIKCT